MKKFLALFLVLAMALSLMACGSSGAAATEEPAEEAEEAERPSRRLNPLKRRRKPPLQPVTALASSS